MAITAINRASPTRRRSKAEMQELRRRLLALLEERNPQNNRGLFYQAIVHGFVAKEERAYDTIIRICTEMRESGEMPWDYIVDGTRWTRKLRTYDSPRQALLSLTENYLLDPWVKQEVNVVIFCEKAALVGILEPVCDEFVVPLNPVIGFPSVSFLHEIAEEIEQSGKITSGAPGNRAAH